MTRKAPNADPTNAPQAQEGQTSTQPAQAGAIAAAPGDGTAVAAAPQSAAPAPANPKRGGLWRLTADNQPELVHCTQQPGESKPAA